jgi:DNA invertase Pin-like site-specific DNA recombinase
VPEHSRLAGFRAGAILDVSRKERPNQAASRRFIPSLSREAHMVSSLQQAMASVPIRAAEYLRKSTQHQRYSIENQADAIRLYAAKRGIQVVRTYADRKSGVLFDKRHGLRQLIEDVLTQRADFKAILVYDVTRWGRFQDPDESAYYEYICKRAGIKVHYCAEQFENDDTSFAAVVKSIKRAMAGEYSRELSIKSFAGMQRLFNLGFRLGSWAPYGIRRLLVDQNGVPKGVLLHGERKSIQTDRILLIPGPPEEIKTVRWIFFAFVKRKLTVMEIVKSLNDRGVDWGHGRRWKYDTVRRTLRREIYIGTDVWNRTSTILGQKQRFSNPPDKWLRHECGFKPIIDPKLFTRAQARIRERRPPLTDEQKLAPIRRLLRKHGYLSVRLVNETPGVFSAPSYARWFGGLREVYRRIGFKAERFRPFSDKQLLAKLRRLLKRRGNLTEKIIDGTSGMPSSTTYRNRFGSLPAAYRLVGFKLRANSQRGRREATRRASDEEVLAPLRALLADRGCLSPAIIAKSRRVPSVQTYYRRFGNLSRAYELIGYSPPNPQERSPLTGRYIVREKLPVKSSRKKTRGRFT